MTAPTTPPPPLMPEGRQVRRGRAGHAVWPDIPAAAWRRPVGLPCPDVGRPRVSTPMLDDGEWGGVPIGGFGTGSIGRTHRGDFARWHLRVGHHVFDPVAADQFSIYVRSDGRSTARVLSTLRPTTLPAWGWGLPVASGVYHALFPRAWLEFSDPAVLGVRLVGEQLSPILAGDYEATSLPVGIFRWTAENPGPDRAMVGLMFSWQNPLGAPPGEPALAGAWQELIERPGLQAIRFHGPTDRSTPAWRRGTFAIAARADAGIRLSHRTRFETTDGTATWADFSADGALDDLADPGPSRQGEPVGAALAATFILAPGERRTVTFSLAWDLPLVEFGAGRRWRKRYTRFWGTTGDRAVDLAAHALEQGERWREAIDAWQRPVLDDPDVPDWYKAALFNELYYLVDGGSFWEDGLDDGAPADGIGRFGLLECFDYPFYNTVDVNFSASYALLQLWPDLERRAIRELARAIPVADPETVTILATGHQAIRKIAGTVPHDLGGPDEDPFWRPNRYRFQDVNGWKDLGPKFVLQVWRDHVQLADPALVHETWPTIVDVLDRLATADRDGDGLPEHDGVPDQTYDTWPMRGPSAYGGLLWLAALRAAVEMAGIVGDREAAERYARWLDEARRSFEERLWTGSYYAYDGGDGPTSDSVMADQLAGQWWADATGLGDLVAPERVQVALRTIHRLNVRGFAGGTMGAVNGMRPDGTVDRSSEQSAEVWVGTTYTLAALMLERGLISEAWETARGAAAVTYERGLWFRTPEAFDEAGDFRASLYLRPLAIWAIEEARRRIRRTPGPG